MKQVIAVVMAVVVASLAACEIATKDGIRSIPAHLNQWFNGQKIPVLDAAVPNAKTLKEEAEVVREKADSAVFKIKDRAKDIAEKAVEAAKLRHDGSGYGAAHTKPSEADSDGVVAVAEMAVDPANDVSSNDSASQPAERNFYGRQPAGEVAGWNSEAVMNPDYTATAETGETSADDSTADAAQTIGHASITYFGAAEKPDAAQPWSAAATVFDAIVKAAAPVSSAEAASTPENMEADAAATDEIAVSTAGQSYYGITATPDAQQPWAADAVVYGQVAAADSASASDGGSASTEDDAYPPAAPLGQPGETSYFGDGSVVDSKQPWAADAAMNPDYSSAASSAPAQETAQTADASDAILPPAPLGPPGDTAYYGTGGKPDNEQPWGGGAVMNPDYGSSNAAATAQSSSTPSDPTAVLPSAEMGPPGDTAYFGVTSTTDSAQPWAAAASPNPSYSVAAKTPPSNATEASVSGCRDALNGAARAGAITFRIDSARLTRQSYATLNRIAELSKSCGGVAIEVSGHTDNTGDAAYNHELSQKRAQAVVSYLTHAGVDASHLKAVGYGEEKPVAGNDSAEGRRKNRRIEFSVSNK